MNLLGQTIQLEKQNCFVRGRLWCSGEEIYALESNKPKNTYNGICGKCNTMHVFLDDPNRGFYSSVQDIHNKVLGDREAAERAKGPKKIEDLPIEKRPLPPLHEPILGKNKGIEGNSNSCYMDSTIFCMFAYSDVFDGLLRIDVGKKQVVKELQRLLRENIVGLLRNETGLVERKSHSYLSSFPSK